MVIKKALTDSTGSIDAQADALVIEAEEAQAQQSSLLESPPLESQYSSLLATYVEAKHEQAERIEERLEHLIEKETASLQQDLSDRSKGFFLRPGKRAAMQERIARRQASIERLSSRLEIVREIKDRDGIVQLKNRRAGGPKASCPGAGYRGRVG